MLTTPFYQVGLDFFVLRKLLAFATKRSGTILEGTEVDLVQAVLDEVGTGIFDELDFTKEAAAINRFRTVYAKDLAEMGMVVPEVVPSVSGQRVLVTEWLDGQAPRDLDPAKRCSLAQRAVKCLAMQLMTDGYLHCDPHEGNLLYLNETHTGLIDFGLMATMRSDHQEAMASGILNIMAGNYEALVPIFKAMGILDGTREDLRRPGVNETFAAALERCMSGDAGEDSRQKLVQAEDGADRRRAFGQLYEELGELAINYYFVIPSYVGRGGRGGGGGGAQQPPSSADGHRQEDSASRPGNNMNTNTKTPSSSTHQPWSSRTGGQPPACLHHPRHRQPTSPCLPPFHHLGTTS